MTHRRTYRLGEEDEPLYRVGPPVRPRNAFSWQSFFAGVISKSSDNLLITRTRDETNLETLHMATLTLSTLAVHPIYQL